MINLGELISKLKEGQVALAYYEGEKWMVIKDKGSIKYFEEKDVWEIVSLSTKNLQAKYEIIQN